MEKFTNHGLDPVDLQQVQASIQLFLSRTYFTLQSEADEANYARLLAKCHASAKGKQSAKLQSSDKYCPQGHRIYLCKGIQDYCTNCKCKKQEDFIWRCETSVAIFSDEGRCHNLCQECYVRLHGSQKAQENGKLYHEYDSRQQYKCFERYQSEVYKQQFFGTPKQVEDTKEDTQVAVVPKCPGNHILAQLKGKIYPPSQAHNCSKCSAQNVDESQSFWNCYRCSYDLCHKCTIEEFGEGVLVKHKQKLASFNPVTKTVGCQKGHILVKSTGCFTDLQGTCPCQICGKISLERQLFYWRCHDCNYDICESCFKKNQKNTDADPNGKIARKAQKERHYRNSYLENLEHIKHIGGVNFIKKEFTERVETELYEWRDYQKAGASRVEDIALQRYIKVWAQLFTNALIEQIQQKQGNIKEEMIALCIYRQFVISSLPAMFEQKQLNVLLFGKFCTMFEKALTTIFERNSDFGITTPKQPLYFASQVYEKGNLYPYLSKFITNSEINIVKIAALNAIPLQYKFVPQMKDILGQFSSSGHPVEAQCKYGKTIGEVTKGYNHGLRRSEMKYLEELGATPQNTKLRDVSSLRDKVIDANCQLPGDLVYNYGNQLNYLVYRYAEEPQGATDKKESEYMIQKRSFCQQDILRCKAYFNSVENICLAINALKQAFPLVRIKNRMNFLGDVMVNFMFGDFVAEAQLKYHEDSAGEDDQSIKIRNKVNHFLYEIVRNPLGPLVHCAELTFKIYSKRFGFPSQGPKYFQEAFLKPYEEKKEEVSKFQAVPDCTEYSGEIVDGLRHGPCKEYSSEGTYFEGFHNKGVKEGQGKMEWTDGIVYIGKFVNNLPNGQGKMIYPNGKVTYTGEFVDGKKCGQGTMTYQDGGVFVGEFKNDVMEGKGKYTWRDSSYQYHYWYFEGYFLNDKMHGEGKLVYDKGRIDTLCHIWKGTWKEGQKEGSFDVWFRGNLSGDKTFDQYKSRTYKDGRAETYDFNEMKLDTNGKKEHDAVIKILKKGGLEEHQRFDYQLGVPRTPKGKFE